METAPDADTGQHRKIYEYLKLLKDEIKREDDVTNQRMTWTIALQSFLFTAFLGIVAFGGATSFGTHFIRKITLIALTIVGMRMSLLSLRGIIASRNSIETVGRAWRQLAIRFQLDRLPLPDSFPGEHEFKAGSRFALGIPATLVVIWLMLSVLTLGTTYVYEVRNCVYPATPHELTAASRGISSCIYNAGQPLAGPGQAFPEPLESQSARKNESIISRIQQILGGRE